MTLIDRLTAIANRHEDVPKGTVQALIDSWLAGRADPLKVGIGEELAAALRSKSERLKADALLPVLRRIGE